MQSDKPKGVRPHELITLPAVIGTAAFLILFWTPIRITFHEWWTGPDAGHGLLLFPIALYLLWRSGTSTEARPQPILGLAIIVLAVLLRYMSGLAAELFTMRWSVLFAFGGLVIFRWGFVQLRHWWLPVILLGLSVPLPTLVLNSLALPLQLKASQLGAAMLEWRHVPVLLTGNVINLPGQSLFVTEACSGLRSLTALISLGVLIGGMWLRTVSGRALLIAAAIPVAMLLNGVRVFLTGFLVFFVNPEMGQGFMHVTEGWMIFVFAFGVLGVLALLVIQLEERLQLKLREVTG